MSYEDLITQNKRETDYEKLQQDLTKVEALNLFASLPAVLQKGILT